MINIEVLPLRNHIHIAKAMQLNKEINDLFFPIKKSGHTSLNTFACSGCGKEQLKGGSPKKDLAYNEGKKF